MYQEVELFEPTQESLWWQLKTEQIKPWDSDKERGMYLIQSITNNIWKICQFFPLPSPVWRSPSQKPLFCFNLYCFLRRPIESCGFIFLFSWGVAAVSWIALFLFWFVLLSYSIGIQFPGVFQERVPKRWIFWEIAC